MCVCVRLQTHSSAVSNDESASCVAHPLCRTFLVSHIPCVAHSVFSTQLHVSTWDLSLCVFPSHSRIRLRLSPPHAHTQHHSLTSLALFRCTFIYFIDGALPLSLSPTWGSVSPSHEALPPRSLLDALSLSQSAGQDGNTTTNLLHLWQPAVGISIYFPFLGLWFVCSSLISLSSLLHPNPAQTLQAFFLQLYVFVGEQCLVLGVWYSAAPPAGRSLTVENVIQSPFRREIELKTTCSGGTFSLLTLKSIKHEVQSRVSWCDTSTYFCNVVVMLESVSWRQ